MKELEYPLDAPYLLKKRRGILKKLKAESGHFPLVKVAILGGSTTEEIASMLEIFLLNIGLKPVFYQSEYNQYWVDVMFSKEELLAFSPDVIYVHTTQKNIICGKSFFSTKEEIETTFQKVEEYFTTFWDKLRDTFSCPVIQNNFELPPHRLMGNQDAVFGISALIARMNVTLSLYASQVDSFYVQDLQYLSADFGLSRWHDLKAWSLYKYALSLEAIPHLASNLSKIIGAIYGKSKKALVLDLDNTLWGGVVGDDGVDQLKLGSETGEGEIFLGFQAYLKSLQERGVLLSIASKNEIENALVGLNHPESLLKPDDFLSIQANWNSKDENIRKIAEDLNLGLDSFVFVDDNPAERTLITQNIPSVSVVDTDKSSEFITYLDRSGYFEVTGVTAEDRARQSMYQQNQKREVLAKTTGNYEDYLKSLEMVAEISSFSSVYLERIAQLCNKTNQFNLTTKRYTRELLEELSEEEGCLTLYGRLSDCFGDNGLVTVVLGKVEGNRLFIELWLMSCRVLKRNLEFAMMDVLVKKAREKGMTELVGTYLPTAKNKMVADFYKEMGFSWVEDISEGGSVWALSLDGYQEKNTVIKVKEME